MAARSYRRVGIAIVLAGALLVAWKLRGGSDDAAAPVTAPHPAVVARTPSAAPALPAEPEPARPQPVPVDPSAHPPSLDAPHTPAAPPQIPFTRDETVAKREADLVLLDTTRARLEDELAAARTGDPTVARGLEIRIARLDALRKQRSTELEAIRAGGALPR